MDNIDYESTVDITEHHITPEELQQIFNDMSISELYEELPLKNIYVSYDNFCKEIDETKGDSLLEKFCTLTIKKCKQRIDYLEDKKETLDVCDVNTNEIEEIIKIEKEALNYFTTLFVNN